MKVLKMQAWKIGVASFLLVALIVTLGIAIATDNAARNGTRDDPLVSRSYLDALQSSLVQEMTTQLRAELDTLVGEMDAHYELLLRNIDTAIANLLAEEGLDLRDPDFIELVIRGVLEQLDVPQPGEPVAAPLFRRVDLSNGQTLRGQVGTEVILRLGGATGVNTVGGNNPAMVSLTSANNLSHGANLVANHLYFITIENNGFRATANNTVVFVRGAFEVVNP